ncbi:MAG: ATP synthase subunit I [Synechococcales bacterium]|nr:ATP synthase subunit I [Synechococcales bacterium]
MMEEATQNSESSPEPSGSMEDYYQLQRELLVITLILTGLIFPAVWGYYGRTIALNYLVGGCTGLAYLRLLGKNVERLGAESGKVGKSQLGLFVAVIILATQVKQLHVLPVFLGFMTFKATLIIYTLKTLFKPSQPH